MTNNTESEFQAAEEVTETNLTRTGVDSTPNENVTVLVCPVCVGPVPMDDTAVYSRRNRAFLHLTCRDAVLARQKQREVAA